MRYQDFLGVFGESCVCSDIVDRAKCSRLFFLFTRLSGRHNAGSIKRDTITHSKMATTQSAGMRRTVWISPLNISLFIACLTFPGKHE